MCVCVLALFHNTTANIKFFTNCYLCCCCNLYTSSLDINVVFTSFLYVHIFEDHCVCISSFKNSILSLNDFLWVS